MFKLSKLSLANRAVVALITVIVGAFGFISVGGLKQELIPSIEIPSAAIVTSYPGASPEVVDDQVSQAIEQAVIGLEGIESTTVTSTTGLSVLRVSFEFGTSTEDVSDAKMERGNVRCDANVSLRPKGQEKLGTRTETKNVNSIRSVENAVRYEIQRQAHILAGGGSITQETRHWHEDRGYTSAGRPKSDADDYRYFPEPDLVPVQPASSWIEEIRESLPENPQQRRKRLAKDWGFSELEFRDVVNGDLLDLVEATVAAGTSPQAARKWWTGELSRQANAMELSTSELAISPDQVATIQKLIDAGDLTDRMAREVVAGVIAGEGTPEQVIEKRGLKVVTDEGALVTAIDEALRQQPYVLEKIREGKVQAAGAVIGAVMKAMGGQVDAARVRELILERAGS